MTSDGRSLTVSRVMQTVPAHAGVSKWPVTAACWPASRTADDRVQQALPCQPQLQTARLRIDSEATWTWQSFMQLV